jgi:hypothetical protein
VRERVWVGERVCGWVKGGACGCVGEKVNEKRCKK